MSEIYISIGQAKQDLAELVRRVADDGERIVLTSSGRPKAALINLDDYSQLTNRDAARRPTQRDVWLRQVDRLSAAILKRRGGKPLDLDQIWNEVRADRDARDGNVLEGP